MREFALPSMNLPSFARRMVWGGSFAAPDSDSDEALFEETIRVGGQDAYARLVARYRVRLIALVRRMLSSSQSGIDPEDIAQEALVDAYRRRETFRRGAKFRPWIYGIAINRCIDKIRAMEREPALAMLPRDEAPDPLILDPRSEPLAAALRAQDLRDLKIAVGFLTPKLRAVFVLRYVDDLGYEEISEACGLPIGTVKTHLFRARAEIKRRLEINEE